MNQMKKQERTGYFQVFAAGALWGGIGVFVTAMGTHGSTGALTSFLRMFFSFLILAVITAARFGLRAFRVDKRTLLHCALLGLVCQGIYNVFYSLAITKAGVTISAVLLNVAPVFTALAARFLFAEKITKAKAAALVINVAGCTLAVTGGSFSVETLSLSGILLGAGAGFCYALTAIFGRFAGEKANAFVVSTYSYLFASVFLFLFLRPWTSAPPLTPALLLWGFFYALIPTAIAYLLYYAGVQKIKESSKVPVLASVETVAAALLGVLVYHEQIGLANLAGIALVMCSILMMNRAFMPLRKKKARQENT